MNISALYSVIILSHSETLPICNVIANGFSKHADIRVTAKALDIIAAASIFSMEVLSDTEFEFRTSYDKLVSFLNSKSQLAVWYHSI